MNRLNDIRPAAGSRRPAKRRGRGIGSGLGKTCGKGHKGQKSRSGWRQKVGFEGGQMPLQRRLPKTGFRSRLALISEEIRLHELNKVNDDVIDIEALKRAGLINKKTLRAKVMLQGSLEKAIHLRGIGVTKGAKQAIEAAGGKVELKVDGVDEKS